VNAPFGGCEGPGAPRSCWPSNGTRQRVVRGPCEDAEAVERGTTAAGEMKRRATLLSPRHQTVMMARRFTAERCANSSIPAPRLDASKLAVPLKYSLLETSGTSPTSSSTTFFPTLPRPMDPSSSFAAAESSSGMKHRGRPPGQQEQGKGSRPVDARRRWPPAHRCAKAGRGESCRPWGLRCLDPPRSYAWRSECAVAGGGGAGSPLPREHRPGAL
jgi:hypothetical protein